MHRNGKILSFLLSIIFILLSGKIALGEQAVRDSMVFQRFNINSGLSSDNLKFIHQDKEGYLWIASDNGINRFDGYATRIFKPDYEQDKGFNSLDFNSIAEDKNGNLWFGTNHSGINIFNKKTQTVTIFDQNDSTGHAIVDNTINYLFCDSKGRIWICTISGLNLYYPESDKMIFFDNNNRPGKNNPFGTISFVYQDRKDRIIIGTWGNGLYFYDEEKDDFTQSLIGSESETNDLVNRVYRILEDKSGDFWLGTWEGGLFKVKINEDLSISVKQRFTSTSAPPKRLSSNIIYCLYEDSRGSIWAGTPYGVNIIKNHETGNPFVNLIQSGNNLNNISYSDVFDIKEDRSGIVWLATGGGGLNKLDFRVGRFEAFSIPDITQTNQSQSVRSFIIDSDSTLLIGVNGRGLGEFVLSENKFIPFGKLNKFRDLPDNLNAATCFHQDDEGNLWIGSRYNGLFRINETSGRTFQYLQLDPVTGDRSRMINVIYQDQYKNIWVGTNNGLFKLTYNQAKKDYSISRYLNEEDNPGSIEGFYISAIFEDADSNLWVGTVGGALNKMKNLQGQMVSENFTHYLVNRENPEALRSNIVYSIFQDKQRRIWIGTGTAGIALYNPSDETFIHFMKEEGLRGDAVFDIIEEGENLWLTTNNGLERFRYKSETEFQVEDFTSEDGLHGNVFIDNASFKSDDGRIFVGGYYGFNVFKPEEIVRNNFVPPLVITSLMVSNKEINVYDALENGLKLKYDQNNLTVSFSALSFSQPDKNKYAYYLEGLSEDWKRSGSEGRIVTFSHIPPGHYTLYLKASNNSDLWNETPLKLLIHVKPHPARSWWAILIYSLFILSVLIVIYYFLINNIKIKQAYEIEKIDRLNEENVNQFKFRFFTNISHELLTPLSVLSFSIEDLISKPVLDKGRLGIMQRNINRIMHLISQLLDFRKVESGIMMPIVSPASVDIFIDQICDILKPIADKKNIRVSVKGKEKELVYFDPDKMDKIISNLLSNALRYTPANGQIIIQYQLKQKEEITWLEITVTDSGKGIEPDKIDQVFERFYQVKSVTGKTFGAGIGLALVKNLVENHKGFITVRNEENMGAQFSVNIPVSSNAYTPREISEEKVDYQSGNFIMDLEDSLIPIEEENGDDNATEKKETILIVEDNFDFRNLLVKHLSNYYNTLEAENGEQGYEICLKKQPNLVITDLMMPAMNGIELCAKIKTSLETSHIIVILLTAKIDEETRYESYLANADSYISKPVDIRTLYTRIESLLAQRVKLIELYSKGQMPSFSETELSELDEKFLGNIKFIIEKKILNTELNVLALSKEIGMSTSNLYRKITSLTGMSPVEFIRYIRLQNAATMMVKQGVNVSEAAYGCGFNDLSYFSKSFKKQFGMSPKNFQKNPTLLN